MQDAAVSNPVLQQLQKRKDVEQGRLNSVQIEKAAQFSRTLLDELDTKRITTSQLLDASNATVASLKQSIADLSMKYANYMTRRDEQEAYRRLDEEYGNALTEMDNKAQMADFGSLAWAVRPLEPSVPSFPKLANTMAGAIMAGLGLSLSIAFLRELTDTTVRSPRDIVRVGQMTILGMVPHEADDPQSTGARLPLVIFEAPHSIMAEQLRQVRTRLQHAASLDTTRSILVTSPSPGDGKSTIAVNLAAGLALNGRRILLIDANFRRPELHRIFGIGNEVGFGDVLNDVNTFASAVRETSVPNLSVMPSGAKPNNSTELLESQLLLDAIERALEEYDHVIFDSGPMLFVSESVALAPRVDGVVTVVRARSSSRGVLLRMRDGLRQVKAEHLGVVLNGVRTQAGGYYGRSIKTYYEYQNNEG
jgi:succinoglycan biosynthesis transport protein ExoP